MVFTGISWVVFFSWAVAAPGLLVDLIVIDDAVLAKARPTQAEAEEVGDASANDDEDPWEGKKGNNNKKRTDRTGQAVGLL